MINKTSIQNLIIEGKLGQAIEQLLEIAKKYDNSLYREVAHQSSRYHSLQRETRQGIISEDDAKRTESRINIALTQLLDEVKDEWSLTNNNSSDERSLRKKTILFLAANPKDTSPLRLDEEVRKIDEGLKRSQYRDQFALSQKWAVRISDLRRAMLDEKPTIVHFSGHGSDLGEIYLEDEIGQGQGISAKALGNFFALFKNNVECVLLNACYSEIQADEIAKNINYVVGMNDAVPDAAAIQFSEAFYDAIGAGENIQFAFDLACNAIEMYNLSAENIPVLKQYNNR